MIHVILPYLGFIAAGTYIVILRGEIKRLQPRSSRSMTMSDFDIVYNWIKSGMPEAVAMATPPGFAKDAMRLVWFAKYGEKK